jgi:hypothetical protein
MAVELDAAILDRASLQNAPLFGKLPAALLFDFLVAPSAHLPLWMFGWGAAHCSVKRLGAEPLGPVVKRDRILFGHTALGHQPVDFHVPAHRGRVRRIGCVRIPNALRSHHVL